MGGVRASRSVRVGASSPRRFTPAQQGCRWVVPSWDGSHPRGARLTSSATTFRGDASKGAVISLRTTDPLELYVLIASIGPHQSVECLTDLPLSSFVVTDPI
ncbi:MAG: hypothetical protein AAF436_18120 [Myxococcota bacterium]